MVIFDDDALAHQQLEPSTVFDFEDFCCDLALADARRLRVLATAFLIDALRPSDDIGLNETFTRGNPLLH